MASDFHTQPLFFSDDNGQCSCAKHKIRFGYSKLDTWVPAEEYSYEFEGEIHYFECEICRQESKEQCQTIFNAK